MALNNLLRIPSFSAAENSEVNIDNVAAEINKLPTFYVEVDKDYNFTRLYFTTDLADGGMTLTADLGFTYPTNLYLDVCVA